MEIRLTGIAKEKIIEAAKEGNEELLVRIYVESASCAGARFGIAFDDMGENDDVADCEGIKFITDREYVPQYADGLDIEYVYGQQEGFLIKPIRPGKGSGGCGCGSSEGSSGGCGCGTSGDSGCGCH